MKLGVRTINEAKLHAGLFTYLQRCLQFGSRISTHSYEGNLPALNVSHFWLANLLVPSMSCNQSCGIKEEMKQRTVWMGCSGMALKFSIVRHEETHHPVAISLSFLEVPFSSIFLFLFCSVSPCCQMRRLHIFPTMCFLTFQHS